MMRSAQIDHFEARSVFHGLLDGEAYRNRVAGACIYHCPRCSHRIRFRWLSLYQANDRSAFKRNFGVFLMT